mmetsp:Transcript_57890/g.103551  ORF Transcript_57890/g.103551 Transcript_57890/m.103551 type:complete len:106 (+) Transcript_57890:21-338(+)
MCLQSILQASPCQLDPSHALRPLICIRKTCSAWPRPSLEVDGGSRRDAGGSPQEGRAVAAQHLVTPAVAADEPLDSLAALSWLLRKPPAITGRKTFRTVARMFRS